MNRDDVIKKNFPHSFFGYDAIEVDMFLDEVIREFDRLHNEIDVLTFRLQYGNAAGGDSLLDNAASCGELYAANEQSADSRAVCSTGERKLSSDSGSADG